jgi:hypothetical protein
MTGWATGYPPSQDSLTVINPPDGAGLSSGHFFDVQRPVRWEASA